jgi:hypothetical protein
MATVNKNFRIKDGLIVEGTTGTINGEDILTTASTTTQLDEGTNLYYTNERVDDRVANLVEGGTGIAVNYDDNGNALGISADFTEFSTTDITEGTKLFFTEQRAIDAVGGSATSENTPNTVVKRDGFGNFATNEVTLNVVTVGDVGYVSDEGSTLAIDATAGNQLSLTGDTGVTIASANGDIVLNADGSVYKGSATSTNEIVTQGRLDSYIGDGTVNGSTGNTITDRISSVAGDLSTHISDTSTHGVSGDIVGTTDAQVLTNKTINDELLFTNPSTVAVDGGIKINDVSEDMEIKSYTANLHLQGQTDVTVTAVNGDIVLNPDGAAYISSVSAGNQIATNSYVDNAVSGLAWKEAVNLLAFSNVPLTGDTGTVIIDGHPALDSTDTYRLLLADQTDPTENGIYVYADNGSTYTLTRTADADVVAELVGAAVFIMEGTTYGGTSWVQNNHYANSFDDLVWTQFSGGGTMVAGTGIAINGLEISIDRATADTWYDEAGAATTAYNNAVQYANDNFVNLDDLPGQLDDYVPLTQKAANNGVATLDAGGDVPAAQLGNVNTAITNLGSALTPSSVIISAGGYFGQSGDSGIRMHSDTNQSVITSETSVCTLQKQASKIVITAKNGSNVQVTEVLSVMDDSHNIYMTEYASVCSAATDLITITIEYAGYGTVQYVKVTPTNAGNTTVTTNQFSIG